MIITPSPAVKKGKGTAHAGEKNRNQATLVQMTCWFSTQVSWRDTSMAGISSGGRAREEVPLVDVAVVHPRKSSWSVGLHPFGDHLQLQGVRHLDGGAG